MALRVSALPAAVAALALAAGCGSDEATSGSASVATGANDDGPRTLALGKAAVSPFVDYGATDEPRPTKVGVRVLEVRKGEIADLKAFDLTAEQRRAVPYYVDARFENLGDFALSRNLLRASMEDADGNEHRPMTLVLLGGTFRKCPETPRAALRPGRSYTACSAILLPQGTEPGRVRFQGDVTKDPLLWKLSS